MDTFRFVKARDVSHAIQAASRSTTAQQGAEVRFVAGGTTLIDLMKLNVERPSHVVDINDLPLDKVEKLPDGRLKIGALVRNFDLAHHRPRVRVDGQPPRPRTVWTGVTRDTRPIAEVACASQQ